MKIYFKDGKQFIFRFNFHITFAKAINKIIQDAVSYTHLTLPTTPYV
ncbi:hypothetical protein JMUB7538_27190 [Staphylococcus aureus]